MKQMSGINTALVTPFDADDRIDFDAQQAHIEFLIARGIDNLYPLGTMGEASLLCVEERKAVAEHAVQYAAGRVGVFVQVGSLVLRDAIELARHAHAIGADGIGALTPYYYHLNQNDLIEYYTAIARSVPEDFPVYMYNLPGMSGNDLLPDTIVKLAELPNICGIKNTMADCVRTDTLLRHCPPGFRVISGDDYLAFPALSFGAKGVVSGTSNMFPELYVTMYQAVQNNDLHTAAAAQQKIYEVFEVLHGDLRPCYVKAVLEMRGLRRTYSRGSLQRQCTEEEYRAIRAGLQRVFSGTDIAF